MPFIDPDKDKITTRNFQCWFESEIMKHDPAEVAMRFGITVDTLRYHCNEVKRLSGVPELRLDIQNSLLSLMPVAFAALREKLVERDVNVLNAYLKGVGAYVLREKLDVDAQVGSYLVDSDPNRDFEAIVTKVASAKTESNKVG